MVGVVILFFAFINKDYILAIPGILFAGIFTLLLFPLIKVISSPDPYLNLTEEGLIIHAISKHAILISWDDISGYHIRNISYNRFIKVLFDHDKYLLSMSHQSKKLYKVSNISQNTLFAFPFGAIKRKNRRKLISELDRLVNSHLNLTDQIYHPEKLDGKKQKGYDRINWKYFLISYAYNFGFTVFAIFIFFVADSESDNIILIVLYFI